MPRTKQETMELLMSLSPEARIAILLAARERMEIEAEEQQANQSPQDAQNEHIAADNTKPE